MATLEAFTYFKRSRKFVVSLLWVFLFLNNQTGQSCIVCGNFCIIGQKFCVQNVVFFPLVWGLKGRLKEKLAEAMRKYKFFPNKAH